MSRLIASDTNSVHPEDSTRVSANVLAPLDLIVQPAGPIAAPQEPPVRAPSTGSIPLSTDVPAGSVLGRHLLHLPRAAWMAADILLVISAMLIGHHRLVWWSPTPWPLGEFQPWMPALILATCVAIAGNIFGLYESSTLWARSRILARCLITIVAAVLATWLITDLFMFSSLSRRTVAFGFLAFLVLAPCIRLLAHQSVREVRRGLLVLGRGPLTGTIIRSVRRGCVPGYRLIGVALDHADTRHGNFASDIPVVGAAAEAPRICREFDVAEVIVAEEACRDAAHAAAAMQCLHLGCRVTDETTFFETAYGQVPVSHISPRWFLSADLKGHRREHAFVKRCADLIGAACGLIIAAPLLMAMALIVRIQDGGPALYSQTRVGRGGRRFTLYKFRTMRVDAEADGTTWAAANDHRVTTFGHWLRRSRLDELPQLWNILRGDMSFVGPRPERPEFVKTLAMLIPHYHERHLVKPGLTGWAQINLAYAADVHDARLKLQHDLYYIKHMSLELDLVILLRTLGTFFRGGR